MNPFDIGMAHRPYPPFPWFDPATYRNAYPGFETNPYSAGVIPRPIFPMPPVSISPEMTHGISPLGFPGFASSEHLSPENFISGYGKTAGNYLPPEFLEFLRAELLRCGKALRTPAPALEHENREVKEQPHLAVTAQFFYALGLLYTRGLVIPPDVSGASSRAEEPSAATACEVFGEASEHFARTNSRAGGLDGNWASFRKKPAYVSTRWRPTPINWSGAGRTG